MSFLRRAAGSERTVIRGSVIFGFGLVFLLWAGSMYDLLHNMSRAQAQTVRLHDWFTETEMLLDEVRAGVLEASVDLRDALLDRSALTDDFYRRQVNQAKAAVEHALQRYEPYTHTDIERRDFLELRRKVSDLWEVAEPILALDERGLQAEALDALQHQILPRRQAVHLMSEHIARLNDGAAEDQRREVARTFRAVQLRAWMMSGVMLIMSCLVTLIVGDNADRMERQIRLETKKNVQNVQSLKRLSDQVVRAGEEERRTIARELHDEIGQALTAVKMDLARAVAACASHPRELDSARVGLDGAIESVRTLSRMLHPMVLEDLGLAAAVGWHLRAFAERSGLDVSFSHAGLETRLPQSIEACVYRTVQEATTNVARHAGANRCRVTIEHSAGRVMAIVEDDGSGFPASSSAGGPPKGLGLISLRERAVGFGGEFEICPAEGGGTRLRIELPVVGDASGAPLAYAAAVTPH